MMQNMKTWAQCFLILIEMAIFIFILLLGLLYAWRKGVLKWA